MITKLQDSNGFVIGLIEWRQVAQSGFDKLYGEYIFVNDLWVHEKYEKKHMIEEMIAMILLKAPEAKFCYFIREKYRGRVSRLWPRSSFERITQREFNMNRVQGVV